MSVVPRLVEALRRTVTHRSLYGFGHTLLLAVAPWALLRAAVNRAFRRAYPAMAAKVRLVVILYAAALLGLALLAPRLLFLVAALAGLGELVLGWRARPAYGCRRGLPRGSLAVLPVPSWSEVWFYREAAARHGPVFKASFLVRPMACVVGFRRALDLLRTYQGALTATPFGFNHLIPKGFLRYMEPGTHEAHRAIFRTVFARRVVDEGEPLLERLTRATLYRMALDSERSAGAGVAPRAYLEDLVFRGFLQLFLGMPPESGRVPRLRRLYDVIDIRNPQGATEDQVVAALEAVEGEIRARWAEIAAGASHGDQPPPSFVGELLRTRPDGLHDPTILRNLIYILHTGTNDVVGLLYWVLKLLSDQASWVARLRGELEGGDPGATRRPESLASRVVLECLRLEQSEYLLRNTTADLRFDGALIPKGWLVRICVRESHRDPLVFDDPHRFDPDRFLARSYTREEYAPFGLHRFTCLGEHLVLATARTFACELARGFDWTVVSDGPSELGDWQHWTPSPSFRIAVAVRG